MSERRTVAQAAAERGGDVAFEAFGTDITRQEKSGKVDVVTEADEAAQVAVIEAIREHYPDDAIVGEEGDQRKTVPETGPAWIIDPIDGTNNFVHGVRRWGTAVAFVRDGRPVTSVLRMPALDETYVVDGDGVWLDGEPISVSDQADPDAFTFAVTLRYTDGLREDFTGLMAALVEEFDQFQRIGSTQYTLALVARGSLDAVVGLGESHPWDTVAGVQMVRQAGGTVTDVYGEPWRHDSEGLLATNGRAHDAVLDRLSGSGVVGPE